MNLLSNRILDLCPTLALCLMHQAHLKETPKLAVKDALVAFKDMLDKNVPQFSGFDQQDAHEFLCFILCSIHEELNRMTSSYTVIDWTDDRVDPMSNAMKSKLIWNRHYTQCSSALFDSIGGLMQSTIECDQCKHKSTTFDPFWNLSLPFPQSENLSHSPQHPNHLEISLSDCLQAFSKIESLSISDGIMCSKCKTKVSCQKKLSIYTFPRVLILRKISPNLVELN
jgi:ubiquitin carboxyl-terminal hydrolase 2/21